MIQTALAAQAEIYNKESADRERILLADFEVRLRNATAVNNTPPASPNSSIRSTIPKICLNMGSPILYNGLGGTSTSAMTKAAVSRASTLASASSSSSSTQEGSYKLLTMDQSKI